jgi:uncharacterized protein YcfL
MKTLFTILLSAFLFLACSGDKETKSVTDMASSTDISIVGDMAMSDVSVSDMASSTDMEATIDMTVVVGDMSVVSSDMATIVGDMSVVVGDMSVSDMASSK